MEHMAEEAKALLAVATGQRTEKLLLPTAAMPSTEELESELGSDFFKQAGNVVVINNSDDSAAR